MTGLAYRCQRCGAAVCEPHADPDVALRRAVETDALFTFHGCPDGGTGICRLVGTTSPHPTFADAIAAREAQ
ncbi:MAG: hypothetical protein ACRENE_14870 [Polyangiaceae bacterium]